MRRVATILLAAVVVGCGDAGEVPGSTGDQGRAEGPAAVATGSGSEAGSAERARPWVVATTPILGDVVAQVGGEAIDLTVLMPPGADPHAFEPSPADAIALEDAGLVFVNGFDLEESLLPLLESRAKDGAQVLSASAGITPRVEGGAECEDEHGDDEHGDDEHGDDEHADDEHGDDEHGDEHHEDEHGHHHGPCAPDPHVWLDPTNISLWAVTIAEQLSVVDPEGAAGYEARASEVEGRMDTLDGWIREQVATVPEGQRRFVTDHETHGWFADRYGVEAVGATLPGFSTLEGASAGELAELEDAIRDLDVPAILVARTVDDVLARRLAEDMGTPLVPIYTGTLSEPEGPAASYEAMMRHDVAAIVEALGGSSE